MSQSYPSNWKKCATCVYWTGPREVDTFGIRITVASATTEGRCMCRSAHYRVNRDAGFICSSYVKWPALS